MDITKLKQAIAMKAMLTSVKADDRLAFGDETYAILTAALLGEKALTKAQANALLNSPVTMRCFKRIYQHQLSQQGNRLDAQYVLAEVLSLAASSGEGLTLIEPDNKTFSLEFIKSPRGRWMVLLSLFEPLASKIQSGTKLGIIDDNREESEELLLQGVWQNEPLSILWPYDDTPTHHPWGKLQLVNLGMSKMAD